MGRVNGVTMSLEYDAGVWRRDCGFVVWSRHRSEAAARRAARKYANRPGVATLALAAGYRFCNDDVQWIDGDGRSIVPGSDDMVEPTRPRPTMTRSRPGPAISIRASDEVAAALRALPDPYTRSITTLALAAAGRWDLVPERERAWAAEQLEISLKSYKRR